MPRALHFTIFTPPLPHTARLLPVQVAWLCHIYFAETQRVKINFVAKRSEEEEREKLSTFSFNTGNEGDGILRATPTPPR